MMTILHGDNRFYNNIFVQGHPITNEEPKESPFYQQVGTHVWDEYPTYKEWIAKFDMEEEKPDMGKLEPAHFILTAMFILPGQRHGRRKSIIW